MFSLRWYDCWSGKTATRTKASVAGLGMMRWAEAPRIVKGLTMLYPDIEYHGAANGVSECGPFPGAGASASGRAGAQRLKNQCAALEHQRRDGCPHAYRLRRAYPVAACCSAPAGARTQLNPANWPALAIFLSSPLAHPFIETYRELQPYWSQEAPLRVDAVVFDNRITVDSHADHNAVVANHLALAACATIINYCTVSSTAQL